jgi:tetratricopeptide (TPR) repeat protein
MNFKLAIAVICGFVLATMVGCSNDREVKELLKDADAAKQNEDYEQAIADYTEAIRLNPRSEKAYFGRGSVLVISGEFGKGNDDLTKAIQLSTNNALAYEMRGYARLGIERYDEAISDYDTALKFNPTNGRVLKVRGEAYYRRHNYTNAIIDFTKALKFRTNDPEIYDDRGGAYWSIHDRDKALDDFNAAVRLAPEDITGLYNQGRLLYKKGQFADAIHDLEKVIYLRPKALGAYNVLAWILATCPHDEIRDGKRAIELATKACELSSWKKFAEIDTLAAAYAETGDFDKAVDYQHQAASMDNIPTNDLTNVQNRIELYLHHKPYRMSDKPGDND